jgi:DNA-binding transcriptional LysR family regulator
MKNDVGWEWWRSFLAVLREGNLSRAARQLGLTQPTVGRHIDELEQALGVSLFTRSPKGLAPTDAGVELRSHAQAMAAAAEALLRAASGGASETRGVVRVTASEIVGVEILPKIFADFRTRYPQVTIELSVTNVTQNLLEREADIAIRLPKPTQGAVIAKQVGKIRFGLFAHRDYLRRHGTPRTMEQLLDHTLIGFDKGGAAMPALPALLRDIPTPLTQNSFAFRSDSALAQVAMVRAGYGIGRGADIAALFYPDVVPVLVDKYSAELDLWVAMHEDARNSRRVRLMFDHLVRSLTALCVNSRSHAGAKKSRVR